MPYTVLQLLPDLNVGGVERGTIEIAQALVRAGHRAMVISAPGRMVEELHACGAEHIAMPIGKKSLLTLACIPKLRKIIVDNKIDIVHARSRLPAWIGWLAIRPLKGPTRPHWVTTVHGPYTVNRYSEIMMSGEKVIAISQFIKDYITDNYDRADAEKIEIVHRGIDNTIFNQSYTPSDQWLSEWRNSAYFEAGRKFILFPGRLTRWKGQHAFIEVVDRLKNINNPPIALVAGSQTDPRSNYENELRYEVQQRGLGDLVYFLGQRNDLLDLFSVADISYSLPETPEAFGRTTLEALSVGTPVIGYNSGGTGEILQHLFPEGLVAEGDIDHVTRKTIDFLNTAPIVRENNAMTVGNMQRTTLAAYESLMST